MNKLQMVKKNLCPLGHGGLDNARRCVKCSSNWIVITPENGSYQSTGYGSLNGLITVFDQYGNELSQFQIQSEVYRADYR